MMMYGSTRVSLSSSNTGGKAALKSSFLWAPEAGEALLSFDFKRVWRVWRWGRGGCSEVIAEGSAES